MNQPVVRTVGNISTAIAQSEFGNSVQRSIQVNIIQDRVSSDKTSGKDNVNDSICSFQSQHHIFRGAAELCCREHGALFVTCSLQKTGRPADETATPDTITASAFNSDFLKNSIHIYLISLSFQPMDNYAICIPRQMLKIHGTQKYNAIMISCFRTLLLSVPVGTLGPCNLTKIRKVEEVQFTGFICISNCTECRKRSCINSIKFAHINF